MFSVHVDDRAAQELLKHLPKQAAFAGAMALTATAKDAQQSIRDELPQRFTIRSKWVANGIRIKPARKGALVASVWSKDEFMRRQEYGGTKSGNVVVPYAARVGGYGGRGKTTRGKWPGSLLSKKHLYFVKETDSGAALFKRMGGKRRNKLKLMYGFEKAVSVKPRFGMRKTVNRVVPHVIGRNYAQAFKKAIATARR